MLASAVVRRRYGEAVAGDRRIERLGSSFAGTLGLLALAGMLSGSVLTRASPRPDLVEAAVFVSQRTVQAGGSLRVTDAVHNRGGARAPRSTTGYYISRDRTHEPGDMRLGGRSIGSLRPRATSRASTTVSIPASAVPGSYRVLACADDRHRIRESDERNNCRATARTVKVTRPLGADRTPPTFAGLASATTCIPGPLDSGMSARYHLRWKPAADNVTPSNGIAYDIYQATAPGGEDFSSATYTTLAGATSFTTRPLPADKAYYFVVRARDEAGNRDTNRVERPGVNLCL